jgi:subtilase family serine protease
MRWTSKRSACAALSLADSRFRVSVKLSSSKLAQAARALIAPALPRPVSWAVESLEPRLLLSGDAVPGVQRIEGSIDQPGEQDSYQFIIDQSTRMLFDGVQGGGIEWQLLGPAGSASFSSREFEAGGDPFLELCPGNYTLNVQARGDTTGNYVFRLFGENSAFQLTPNQPIIGELAAGHQAALYRVNLQSGDRLFFQADHSDGGVTWSLYDPHAVRVSSANPVGNDSSPWVATGSGTYWLAIEGQAGNSTSPAYGFTLFKQTPPLAALVLGQAVTAQLDQPGAGASYSFDVTQAGLLAWDQLGGGADGVSWELRNAQDQLVGSGNTGRDDGICRPLAVQAGHYTLNVGSNDRSPAPVQFRLLHSAMGQTLSANQLLDIGSGSGRDGRVYHVAAMGPANLSLAALLGSGAPPGTRLGWVLTDRRGVAISSGSVGNGEGANFKLNAAADYYLWLDGSAGNHSGFGGQLRVNTWVDQRTDLGPLAAASDSHFAGALAANGQSALFGFDLPVSSLWAFSTQRAPAGVQWQLTGPNGIVVDPRWLSDTQGQGSAALYLSAGHYTLSVKVAQGIGGAFDLQARPGAALFELQADSALVLPDLAAADVLWLRTVATPGDAFSLFFDSEADDYEIRAFDAYGRLAFSGRGGNANFAQTPARGPLYLCITRPGKTTADVAGMTLTRVPAPVPPAQPGSPIQIGSEVNATAPSQPPPSYAVDLPSAGLLFIEAFDTRASSGWSMTGPRGAEASGWAAPDQRIYDSLGNSHSWPAVTPWLPAGEHQITFDQTSLDFSFRLHSSAEAEVVQLGEELRRSLAPTQHLALFALDLAAGDDVQVTGLSQAGLGNFFALYDQNGEQVFCGDPAAANAQRFTALLSGRYTLAVYRGVADSDGSTEIDLRVSARPHVADPLQNLGTISSTQAVLASLAFSNQVSRFDFDVASSGLWMASPGAAFDGAQWLIFDPQQHYIAGSGFDQISSHVAPGVEGGDDRSSNNGLDGRYDGAVYLAAGHYQLRFISNLGLAGDMQLTLRPFAQARPIAADQDINLGAVAPGQGVLLTLPTAPQDQFTVDLGALQAEFAIKVWDAEGRVLSSLDWAYAGRNYRQRSAAGPVTIWLVRQSRTWTGAPVLVADTPLTLRATVTANPPSTELPAVALGDRISTGSSTSTSTTSTTYSLSLATRALLFFDVLGGQGDSSFVIDGPNGWNTIAAQTTWSNTPIAWLPPRVATAGQTQITVNSPSGISQDWRLLSAADAPLVLPGSRTQLTLDADHPIALYGIDLQAGDLVSLVPGGGAGSGNGYALVDEAGQFVGSGDTALASASMLVQTSGHYTLMLTRQAHGGSVPGDGMFDFRLQRVAAQPAASQSLGLITTGTLSSLALTPGNASGRVEFDIATPSAWSVSGLAGDDALYINLHGPSGQAFYVNWAELAAHPQSAFLLPGHYTIEIDSPQRLTTNITLRLDAMANATPVAVGDSIDLAGLELGDSRWVSLNAHAADTLNALVGGSASGDYTIEVLDGFGNVLAFQQALSDPLQTVLQRDATLVLRITRQGDTLVGMPTLTLALQPGLVTPATATPIELTQKIDWFAARLDFEFDVATDGWISLNWESGNWACWTLTGPRGTEAQGNIREAFRYQPEGGAWWQTQDRQWNAPLRWIPAGHYTLRLSQGSGQARFTLAKVGQAQPLTLNTPISKDLTAGNSYAMYDLQLDPAFNTFIRGLAGASANDFWRVYDGQGRLVASGDPQTDWAVQVNPAYAGHYLLALASNTYGSGGTALRFEVDTAPRDAVPVTLGDSFSGRFFSSFQTLSYAFDVAAPAQVTIDESSSSGSTKTYSLVDANGRVVSPISPFGRAVFALTPGRYTLRVQRSDYGNEPGTSDTFSASVQASAQVRALTPSASTNVSFSNALADSLLQLELQAGQNYWLSTSSPLTYADTVSLQVFDPQGRLVVVSAIRGQTGSAGTAVAADQTGTYTVMLGSTGNYYSGYTGTRSIALRQAQLTQLAYMPGSDVSGALANPQDELHYRFTLLQDTDTWITLSGDDYQATLFRVDGAGGKLIDSSLRYGDVNQVSQLAAGTYDLVLRALTAAPGRYRLLLQDTLTLPTLVLGQANDASVNSSSSGRAWQFDALAGQHLLIDPRANSYASTYWTLVGPNNATVASGYGSYSGYGADYSRRLDLPASGRYVLYTYGDSNASGARSSLFTVSIYNEPVTPIQLGDQVSGSMATPGDINHYTFTLDQDTTILLEPQGGDASLALTSLSGLSGAELNLALNSVGGYTVRRLMAGSYSLDVTSLANAAATSFAFKLSRLQDLAVAHGSSGQLIGELPASPSSVVHSFDVLAGHGYTLECTTPLSYPSYIRYSLVDVQGRVLSDGIWASDPTISFTAAGTGPVYLLISRTYPSTRPASFEATVLEPVRSVTALAFDTTFDLQLRASKDTDEFTFEMTTPGWIELRGLMVTWGNLLVQVVSPDGSTAWSEWLSADYESLPRSIYLDAGLYALRFSNPESGPTDSVHFSAVRVPAAHQLEAPAGVTQTLSLPSGSDTLSLWSLNALPGAELVLSAEQWHGMGQVHLLDAMYGEIAYWEPGDGQLKVTLTNSGHVLLRVERADLDEVDSNAFSFSVTWGTASTPVSVTSTLSAAGLLPAGSKLTFSLEVTQAGLWYLDRNAVIDGTSFYYSTIAVSDAFGRVRTSTWDQPMWLTPGVYTLRLGSGGYSTSYDFSWKRLDAGAPASLSYGQSATTAYESLYLSKIYRIDARAGDVLRYNVLGIDSSKGSTPTLRFVNRYGQALTGWQSANADAPPLSVTSDGPVYLIIDYSAAYGAANGSLSFQIDNGTPPPVPLVLGQTVSGTLNPQTQERSYTFTLTADTTLQFDRLNSGTSGSAYDLSWELRGPYDQPSVSNILLPGNQAPDTPLFHLAAGTYTLKVSNHSFNSDSYAFRLLDLAAALPLQNAQVVEGRADGGGAMLSYSIEAQAGDHLFVDFRELSSRSYAYDPALGNWRFAYTATVRLVDPLGRVLASGDLGDLQALAMTSGRYTVLIDDAYAYDSPASFRLAVFLNRPSQPRVIDLGDTALAMDLVVQGVTVAPATAGAPIQSGSLIKLSWITLNQGVSATLGDFSDRVIVRRADTGEVVAQVTVPYVEAAPGNGSLQAGQSVWRQVQIRLPDGPQGAGILAVTVETDTDNSQPEHGSAEENNRSFASFSSSLADYANLQVADLAISPSANWQAGDPVTVSWTTRNAGAAAASGAWTEHVELLNQSTGAVVASIDLPFSGQALAAGASAARSTRILWPAGLNATGQFRLLVSLDVLAQVPEYGASGTLESDNSAEQRLVVGPDLIARKVGLLQTGDLKSGDSVTLLWEDVNLGSVATPVGYQDRVVVRQRHADGSPGVVILNTAVAFSGDAARPLAAGEARTRQLVFTLPDGALGTGIFDVLVSVDSATSGSGILFETNAAGNAETNNDAAGSFGSSLRQYADLSVTSLVVPASIESGAQAIVSWTVVNQGLASAAGSNGNWVDRIVLSQDGVIGNADDVVLASITRSGTLGVGDSYSTSATVRIPTRLQGSWRIALISDVNAAVREPDTRADNLRISGPVAITQTYADLAPVLTSLPAELFANRNAHIEWRVSNQGTIATDVNRWTDQVYLSSTPSLAGATLLGSFTHVGTLAIGASYDAGIDVRLPAHVDGPVYLLVRSDAYGEVYELGRTSNNLAATVGSLTVQPEPRANLVVQNLSSPATWRVGDSVTVGWTVANIGNDTTDAWLVESLRLVDALNPADAIDLPWGYGWQHVSPGQSYSRSATFTVPSLPAGTWRLEITADAAGTVSESNEADNRASASVQVQFPDLLASHLQTSGNLRGGEPIRLSWSTLNQGTADAVNVRDAVYLSRDGSLDSQLGEIKHGVLAAGSQQESTLDFVLPVDASGDWRIVIVTDSTNANNEGSAGEANNQLAQAFTVQADAYADLAVTQVSAPPQTIADPASLTVAWTVKNQGNGVGRTTTWTDRVVYSSNDVFGDSDDILLGTVTHDGALQVGDGYSASLTVQLAPGLTRRGKILVRTDFGATVWEGGLEANNQAASGQVDVMPIPYADLRVESVSAPANAFSGKPINVSWMVANRGIAITHTDSWSDQVWLSSNPDGSGSRWNLGSTSILGALGVGGTYTRTLQCTLPQGLAGTYYVNVATGGPFEFVYAGNNTGNSAGFSIQLSPAPDLIVESVVGPGNALEGALIDVGWTVLNQGLAGAAGSWIDTVELVPLAGGAAVSLGSFSYDRGLESGIRYTRTEQLRLPPKIQGGWRLRVTTNASNSLYEFGDATRNNVAASADVLQVALLPRPDLRIVSVTVPSQATAGGTAGLSFTVINLGPVATSGAWTDDVYLSLDGQISGDDRLVASLSSGAALAPGESYTTSVAAVDIPIRLRGSAWFIVVADGGNRIDEYPNEANNVASGRFTINPVPFADLVTSNVVAPDQAVHGGTITVSYTVTNKGSATTRGDSASTSSWTDSVWLTVDKTRPSPYKGDIKLGEVVHSGKLDVDQDYLGNLTLRIPDGVSSGQYYLTVWSDAYDVILEDTMSQNINLDDASQVDNNNYKARPITVLGLTPPDLVLTQVLAPAATTATAAGNYSFSYTVQNRGDAFSGPWTDRVWMADNADLNKATVKWLIGSIDQNRTLGQGEAYTHSQTVALNPAVGGLQLVVVTDAWGQVREQDEGNNARSVASNVSNAPADLQVAAVHTEAQNFSGELTPISWTVTNYGAAVWAGTKSWLDRVYISTDPSLIPSRATCIGSLLHSNQDGLAAGASYTASGQFQLPAGTDGPYYVYVVTDSDPRAFNDAKRLPLPQAQGERMSGEQDNANTRDSFYNGSVYEGRNNDNNVGQGLLAITYLEPDLQVGPISVSNPNPQSGETLTVTWTLTNHGTRATRQNSWFDGIYLSIDDSLDGSDLPLVDNGTQSETQLRARLTQLGSHPDGTLRFLQPGESVTNSATFTLPSSISGNYRLIVKADTGTFKDPYRSTASSVRDGLDTLWQFSGAGSVPEFKDEGNNLASVALPISLAAPPDLQVTQVITIDHVIAGQAFTLSYRVDNLGGSTPGDQGSWNDLVFLSKDRFLDTSKDRYLGYVAHGGGLAAGAGYSADLSFTAPRDLVGPYYVFVITDPANTWGTGASGQVYEFSRDSNNANAALQPILIDTPPPADLQVQSVSVPPSANVGDEVQISYTVSNLSINPAYGRWTDALYLSSDNAWDLSDILIGKVAHDGDLNANGSYTATLTASLPPLKDGSWRVIVRPDLYNEVFEGAITYTSTGLNIAPGEANNRVASGASIHVTLPSLTVGNPQAITLASGDVQVYKVSVAAGQTLAFTLESGASSGANEVYVRYGDLPSGTQYDAAYTNPVAPDQRVLIPSTQAGDYYVLVRSRQSPAGTAATLRADLLPLQITRVTPDQGGTGDDAHRWVSLEIFGARFDAGALVKLARPGVAEIEPERWQVMDATHIRAVFDLRQAPLGLYDVVVTNPDGQRVVEAERFLVERAIEDDIGIGIGGASNLDPGQGSLYSVTLQSLTNVDTPYVKFTVGATELGASASVLGTPGAALRGLRLEPRRQPGRCGAGHGAVQHTDLRHHTHQRLAAKRRALGRAGRQQQHQRLQPGARLRLRPGRRRQRGPELQPADLPRPGRMAGLRLRRPARQAVRGAPRLAVARPPRQGRGRPGQDCRRPERQIPVQRARRAHHQARAAGHAVPLRHRRRSHRADARRVHCRPDRLCCAAARGHPDRWRRPADAGRAGGRRDAMDARLAGCARSRRRAAPGRPGRAHRQQRPGAEPERHPGYRHPDAEGRRQLPHAGRSVGLLRPGTEVVRRHRALCRRPAGPHRSDRVPRIPRRRRRQHRRSAGAGCATGRRIHAGRRGQHPVHQLPYLRRRAGAAGIPAPHRPAGRQVQPDWPAGAEPQPIPPAGRRPGQRPDRQRHRPAGAAQL